MQLGVKLDRWRQGVCLWWISQNTFAGLQKKFGHSEVRYSALETSVTFLAVCGRVRLIQLLPSSPVPLVLRRPSTAREELARHAQELRGPV